MIYKTRVFVSLIKKETITDKALINVCKEMAIGFYDADLGGNVYKKRIGAAGRGKSAGYRVIIGANIGEKYFFLYAFAKNARANINAREKLALKELAKEFLGFAQVKIDELVADGELIIVGDDNE